MRGMIRACESLLHSYLETFPCVAHQCSYYRTGGGAEVDLVIEGAFGLVAVEIKHASAVGAHDLRSLREFVAEQRARLGVVVTTDVAPRQYDDKLLGVPFAFL
jgi:hypothetical protein